MKLLHKSKPYLIKIILLIAFLYLCLIPSTQAHPLNNGYSQVTVNNKTVKYTLTIPEPTLLKYDTDNDRQLTLTELQTHKEQIFSYLNQHLQLFNHSEGLALTLLSMEKTEETGISSVQFNLSYESNSVIEMLDIRYTLFFDDADPLHINFFMIEDQQDIDQTVFDTVNRSFHYQPLDQSNSVASAWKYFVLGIEHILTGYDHLLFLLSLILIATRFKEIIKIVTAFTIAHSITLFLAATGHIHVDSRWIEAGIALTICYVAIENPFVKTVRLRWVLTFFFGLIHGMGFAGALSDVGLPQKYFMSSLLAFNLGVEAGQLTVIMIVLPLLMKLQSFTWYRKVVLGGSALVFLLAFYWFLQRIGIIVS